VAPGDLEDGRERLAEVDLSEAAVEAVHHEALHLRDEGAEVDAVAVDDREQRPGDLIKATGGEAGEELGHRGTQR